MTQEDKARRYDEALEIARDYYKANIKLDKVDENLVLEDIFSELKESEDERIRKTLIEYFNEQCDMSDWNGVYGYQVVAWLEKQAEQKPYGQRKKCFDCQFNYAGECKGSCQMKRDEQKPVDKVEPKFKVGNWYQCTKDFFGKGVTFDKNTAYYCAKEGCLQNEYRCHIAIVKGLYDNFKLWDISDAKDGDVLCYETKDEIRIFIYKNGHIHYHCCYCNAHLTTVDSFFVVEKYLLCYVHPATKEQRDLLFVKMQEAGYEWNAEKKELKEIEFKPDDIIEESYQQQADNSIDMIWLRKSPLGVN